MQIQPFTLADISAIPELQPLDWGDITSQIKYYLQSPFCHPIKVVVDDKVVGIGSTIIHGNTAWLGHIIVHPDFRNKGIGKLITNALVDSLKTNDCKTILLIATALGEPVYKSLGFENDTEYLFFKGEKLSADVIEPENIIPSDSKYKNELFALDRKVSGENRKWRLMENLDNAYMYVSKNALEGFYLPTLGEGLIIANTEIAGKSLMELRLKKIENAVFPVKNLAAQEVMQKHKFNHFRTAKRMYLGKKLQWQPENLYNRVAGNIG